MKAGQHERTAHTDTNKVHVFLLRCAAHSEEPGTWPGCMGWASWAPGILWPYGTIGPKKSVDSMDFLGPKAQSEIRPGI
jgi:hypothetical protein